MIETERLRLRDWRDADLPGFAALNADARVMEHFPGVLSRELSDTVATRLRTAIRERGFGFWAVEVIGGAPFVGFVGLSVPRFEAHFTPCVEIGWRLAFEHWGNGYATEAAKASLAFGFTNLKLDEIVAFTVPANWRSRKVMEKIGMMRREADDFDVPNLPEGHPIRRHVLYRLSRKEWETGLDEPYHDNAKVK
jgi:RimJ/RimL family protein N-acetyltransferase